MQFTNYLVFYWHKEKSKTFIFKSILIRKYYVHIFILMENAQDLNINIYHLTFYHQSFLCALKDVNDVLWVLFQFLQIILQPSLFFRKNIRFLIEKVISYNPAVISQDSLTIRKCPRFG